jgi:hypothetical protein
MPTEAYAHGGLCPMPARAPHVTEKGYSNPKSFVNFLLPPREFGEGWGGVKNLRLLQGLL